MCVAGKMVLALSNKIYYLRYSRNSSIVRTYVDKVGSWKWEIGGRTEAYESFSFSSNRISLLRRAVPSKGGRFGRMSLAHHKDTQ
jgi:hypothetical protein